MENKNNAFEGIEIMESMDTVKMAKIAATAVGAICAMASNEASMSSRAIIGLVAATEIRRAYKKDNLSDKSHLTESTSSLVGIAVLGLIANTLFGK